MSVQIKNLGSLLGNCEIIATSTSQLTAAGDNYGSLIFGVDITVKDGTKERQIRTVAKKIPQNPYIRDMFNTQKTFRNEVGFYETIMPCLRQLQKDQGFTQLIDSSPKFIAGRLNLNPASTSVDDDAILLIKNLKEDGFQIIDKTVGFDLDQSKKILEKMAELHGTTMALKMLKPKIFHAKVEPFFEEFRVFDAEEEDGNKMFQAILDSIKNEESCAQNMQKIEASFSVSLKSFQKNNKDFHRSPFLGLIHTDLWANNIMVKIEKDEIVDVKFVDFQLYEYSSLSKDVVFFIFSSVQIPVLQQHCDELLVYYFDCLINTLKGLKCESSNLKYEDFLDDMGLMIRKGGELLHILVMLAPIYNDKEEAHEVEDSDADKMTEQRAKLSTMGKQRADFTVSEFVKRKWL